MSNLWVIAVYRGDKRDRLIQLVDVATGLEYMHSIHMVHGDLKGVRSHRLLEVLVLKIITRRMSSSTKVSVLVLRTLVCQPSSV